jgi:hypothetical protein
MLIFLKPKLSIQIYLFLLTGCSEGYSLVCEKRDHPPEPTQLLFVANTLPIQFKQGTRRYIPKEGVTYPLDETEGVEPFRGCCTVM